MFFIITLKETTALQFGEKMKRSKIDFIHQSEVDSKVSKAKWGRYNYSETLNFISKIEIFYVNL